MSIWAELDEDEETLLLFGPKHQGKWTCPQAGQAEFLGISEAGIDRYNELRDLAKLGRTAQGLAVEKAFLAKYRADKNIEAPTMEEETARRNRNRRGQARNVAVAPAMDVAAVQGRFDD